MQFQTAVSMQCSCIVRMKLIRYIKHDAYAIPLIFSCTEYITGFVKTEMGLDFQKCQLSYHSNEWENTGWELCDF